FLASAAGLAALSFANLTLAETNGATQGPQHGGTLTIVVTPEPTMLTSAFNTASPTSIVSTKILEGLVTYDPELNLVPSLAKSWEWSADGLSLTFDLQRNVKWHDRKDFTSEDVKFTLMNVWKELHAYGRAAFANVQDVETPD